MGSSAASAVARRTFADSRVRNGSFAAVFFLISLVNVLGYRNSFGTLAERITFAQTFGANKAVRLFYGTPHDLLSVGGYVAWRVGGTVAIAAGVWGVFAAVRAFRTEEDSGRQELVAAGALTRARNFLAALLACVAGLALLWLGLLGGLLVGGLALGPSAYLALAAVSPGLVFVSVGILASQMAATRRVALGVANAAFVAALLLRIVADTGSGLGWLRWATPLGWAEELRPFTGARPAVLLLPAVMTAVLLAVALVLARSRDVGVGLIQVRDTAAARMRLLSSPTALALREERGSLIGWTLGVGFFALIVGLLSHSFSTKTIPASLERELHKLGGASIVTPSGALGFYFLIFVLVISLFACAQVAAMRSEEAEQRLETLFSLPVSRRRWFGQRLGLAIGGGALLALVAALLAWLGAVSQGGGVSLPDMLGAGANCLPTALLFLGITALAFALIPRATAAAAYVLVAVAFLWELFGALLGAPAWLLGVSPFHHVGLVPAQSFKATAAVVMLAIALAAGAAAIAVFERRDLTGA